MAYQSDALLKNATDCLFFRSDLEIRTHFSQGLQQLLPLSLTQSLDGNAGQASSLASQCLMDRGAARSEVETQIASISFVSPGFQQTPVPEPADQACELALVAARMRNQIAQGCAGLTSEEPEHLALHLREVVRAVTQRTVLLRAKQVHHGMNSLDDSLCALSGGMVDNINFVFHYG